MAMADMVEVVGRDGMCFNEEGRFDFHYKSTVFVRGCGGRPPEILCRH
jgi:hypothetical protein